jgi:hypothetical protein
MCDYPISYIDMMNPQRGVVFALKLVCTQIII